MAVQEVATEHPHIVQVEGVRGGRPVIRGTGLTVDLIARFYKMGVTPEELLATYPQLTPAALYDALSYYHDHQQELDQTIAETSDLPQHMRKYGFTTGEKGRVIFTGRTARSCAGQAVPGRRCRLVPGM